MQTARKPQVNTFAIQLQLGFIYDLQSSIIKKVKLGGMAVQLICNLKSQV